MLFYLGTHRINWLKDEMFRDVPLFVSHRTLGKLKGLKPALMNWALDSGGFTEISKYGKWETTPETYAANVTRFMVGIGRLDFAAIQDWMCEPVMLKKTGLSVFQHQQRTTQSYFTLSGLAPDAPWAPVLQGWEPEDYLRHADSYERVGVDLASMPAVGVGSVCRRQTLKGLKEVLSELNQRGYKLHGFGIKAQGRALGPVLTSSDSLAWSFRARRQKIQLPGCTHLNCANCAKYALQWRADLLPKLLHQ